MSQFYQGIAGGGGGGSVIQTVTGNTGGPIAPVANNINLLGQDGITVNGSVGTEMITPRGSGTLNMFLGQGSGNLTLSGSANVGYGGNSLFSLTSSLDNVACGVNTLRNLTTGQGRNTAVGGSALFSLISGRDCVAIGAAAAENNLQNEIVAIGSNALLSNSTGSHNTAIGTAALSLNVTNSNSTAIGYAALANAISSGNTATGYFCLENLTSGNGSNSAYGSNVGINLLTGSFNCLFGISAGNNYTSSESSNILIANSGSVGESHTLKIGTQGSGNGEVNKCFIAGIVGATQANPEQVWINNATNQLFTFNGIVGPYTATPASYQVLATDYTIGVTSTAAARTITMPNSGIAQGQSWVIKDESGGAATNNITISGNGFNIDGAATFVISTNYGSVDIYWNGSAYFIF